jgi:hypothetical protein
MIVLIDDNFITTFKYSRGLKSQKRPQERLFMFIDCYYVKFHKF